ncbi:hypothetical protein TNCV_2011001 [Trichonephila clavipes]|nr:hypothetical protein TNCV_2011001 [Trichonephila clavipes]
MFYPSDLVASNLEKLSSRIQSCRELLKRILAKVAFQWVPSYCGLLGEIRWWTSWAAASATENKPWRVPLKTDCVLDSSRATSVAEF